MVSDGTVAVTEEFLEESNRRISLRGEEDPVEDGVAELAGSQVE
jgi:hypothetical protein